MGTVNDEILRATGGPTVPDGLRAWYLSHGASSGTLQDMERQFLLALYVGGTEEMTIADLWRGFLIQSGYITGTLQDKQLQYWTQQP